MRMVGNPIVITTGDGDSRVIRTDGKSVANVMNEVELAIQDMYRESEVCFEEFVECGELEITGLPLNIQVLIFARLKEKMDNDIVYIESPDGDFPTMKLRDYLSLGPGGQED